MAFLAVAMKDTALAANPLIVVPAIFKVPLGYLVRGLARDGHFHLRQFGRRPWRALPAPRAYHTRDMSVLFKSFALRASGVLVACICSRSACASSGCSTLPISEKFGWFDR